MSLGLLAAAFITISPYAADVEFYDQNPVLLLNDPKIVPLVGVTEDQKPLLQGDLNDWVRTAGDRAKLKVRISTLEFERKKLERQGVKLETDVPTFEKEFAEFDATQEEVKRRAVSRLSPEQAQRLSEISFQLAGIDAFSLRRYTARLCMTNADFAMASAIAREQVAKFRELSAQARAEILDRSEMLKALAASERKAIDEIVSQLEPQTRAAYDRLAGEPIEITKWELRTNFSIEPVELKPAETPEEPAP